MSHFFQPGTRFSLKSRKIFFGLRYYLPFFNMNVVYDNRRWTEELGPRVPVLEPIANYIDGLLDQIELDEALAEVAKP